MTAIVARSQHATFSFERKEENGSSQQTIAPLAMYKITREIGSGGSGNVYAARDRITRQRVALKRIRPEFYNKFSKMVKNEYDIHAMFQHPNIIRVHTMCFDGGVPVLIMERARMNLIDLLDAKPLSLIRPILQLAVYHVLMGLTEIHERGIVHCDVKVENVLVGYDGKFKLADFGFAQTVGTSNKGPLCGTPQYMPPEAFAGHGVYDSKFDIWSLGVMTFACLVGAFPTQVDFQATDQICRNLAAIYKQGYINYSSQIGELSIEDVAFLQGLLVVNPMCRPTAKTCFGFSWLHVRNTTLSKRKKLQKHKRLNATTQLAGLYF